jgi:hypothetical protein
MATRHDFSLVQRASRAIARRQARARLARWLIPLLLIAAGYLDRVSGWFALGGLALVLLILVVIIVAEQQKCPRCGAPLTRRHWWGEEFAPECRECGLPID